VAIAAPISGPCPVVLSKTVPCGKQQPVFMLDVIDKLGQDFRAIRFGLA
jgi:ATP-dependent Lon protease